MEDLGLSSRPRCASKRLASVLVACGDQIAVRDIAPLLRGDEYLRGGGASVDFCCWGYWGTSHMAVTGGHRQLSTAGTKYAGGRSSCCGPYRTR